MHSKRAQLWTNWSISKLQVLEKCPFAFKLAYVDRVVVPQAIDKIFGSTIHYFAKRFFVLKNGYKNPDTLIRSFIHFWNGVLKQEHGPSGYNSAPVQIREKNKKDYFGLGSALLKKFYEENLPYRNGTLAKPSFVELSITFKYQGLKIKAVIDRIQPTDEGEVLYDYKTSSPLYSATELIHNPQFTLYSLAYFKRFGKEPAKLALWHLSPSGSQQIFLPNRTKQQYAELMDKIIEASHFVHDAVIPPSRTCLFAQKDFRYFCLPRVRQPTFYRVIGRHCSFCDFEEICQQHTNIETFSETLIQRTLSHVSSKQTIQPSLQI